MQSVWCRSNERVIAGVCAGLAKKLGVDAWLVRFVWIVSILFLGMGVFLYLLLTLALPREDHLPEASQAKILGVCSRLAREHGIDIGLTRFVALLLLFASFGWALLVYVILYFALPEWPQTK